MPYFNLTTNVSADEKQLAAELSTMVSEAIGKPEQWVMIHVAAGRTMLYSGSDELLAHVVFNSIGLTPDKTPALAKTICDFLQTKLGVSPDRVYIEFGDLARNMTGWNGATFEK